MFRDLFTTECQKTARIDRDRTAQYTTLCLTT